MCISDTYRLSASHDHSAPKYSHRSRVLKFILKTFLIFRDRLVLRSKWKISDVRCVVSATFYWWGPVLPDEIGNKICLLNIQIMKWESIIYRRTPPPHPIHPSYVRQPTINTCCAYGCTDCTCCPSSYTQDITPGATPLDSPRSGSGSDAAYDSLRGILGKAHVGKYFAEFRRREIRLEELKPLTRQVCFFFLSSLAVVCMYIQYEVVTGSDQCLPGIN